VGRVDGLGDPELERALRAAGVRAGDEVTIGDEPFELS
jgi:hypothetical protein